MKDVEHDAIILKYFHENDLNDNCPMNCIICNNNILIEDEVAILTCYHIFHIFCIESIITRVSLKRLNSALYVITQLILNYLMI